jgi:flagellar assembly protein FliH
MSEPAPRLIKAETARSLGSRVAFNYDDLRRNCDLHIEQAREQARQILAEARAEAREIRDSASAQGKDEGLRAGFEAASNLIETRAGELAHQGIQEQLRTVLPAFREAARALAIERDRWLSAWEGAAVGLSAAIAGRILRRELAADPAVSAAVLREALELAAGTPIVSVRLNPDDVAGLGDCAAQSTAALAGLAQAQIVPDDSISRGGCLIETRHGVIDARIETQLERISRELVDDE